MRIFTEPQLCLSLLQPAVLHFQHNVRFRRHCRVMGHNHHAAALLMGKPFQYLHDVPAVFAVQVACRFVRQDDTVAGGEGSRNRCALLFSAGEHMWELL